MTGVEAVLLPVGADVYGVPMTWMREVLALPLAAMTPLVTSRPVVLGLINLRGEIVPLLDTAALLGVGTVAVPSHAAVLYTAHGPVGLAATAMPERALLGASTGPSELAGTAGVYQVERRVVVLLDPLALLDLDHLGGADVRGRSTAYAAA